MRVQLSDFSDLPSSGLSDFPTFRLSDFPTSRLSDFPTFGILRFLNDQKKFSSCLNCLFYERGLSFDNGEHSKNNFVSDNIARTGFLFAFFNALLIVLLQFRITAYSRSRSQFKQEFHCFVGQVADTGFTPNGFSATGFKRGHSTVASKLPGIGKANEVFSINHRM